MDEFFDNKSIDINIIYLWRIHMLHPYQYKRDCNKHFGFVLSPTFHRYVIDVKLDNLYKNYSDQLDVLNAKFTSYSFIKSLIKNLKFMKNVLDSPELKKDETWKYLAIDYQNYLYFASFFYFKTNDIKNKYQLNLGLCPLLSIDFIWHSHQIFPEIYWKECKSKTHSNMVLDHHDVDIPDNKLKQYKKFSDKFWDSIKVSQSEIRSTNRLRFCEKIAEN